MTTSSPFSRPTPTADRAPPPSGWRHTSLAPSLPEVHRSILVPGGGGVMRKMLAFAGPGLMVAVGYMDPGNWATDLQGGAQFGYTLLSVILISNFMAILLQHLALKLGIVTDRDLAQACRDHSSKPWAICQWIICEIAIAACDLAEVIGSAIALNLLFHVPMVWGVAITALDVLLVLLLQNRGFRVVECLVASLILVIGGCFFYNIMKAHPPANAMLRGLFPTAEVVTNPKMLYVAIGILGATVMPHNLYLHSSIVQTRAYERSEEGKRSAIKYATIDSTVALLFAFFINAAILVLAAATFHGTEHANEELGVERAYELLSPALGIPIASTLFAVALLASGQNSTLTGTLAGQIVMEGFLNIRLKPWQRRLITRLIAIVPAAIVAAIYGAKGTNQLLVLSQVILSMQLPFAVVPLIRFTSDRRKMGGFANSMWLCLLSWVVAAVIIALNVWLLVRIGRDVFGAE